MSDPQTGTAQAEAAADSAAIAAPSADAPARTKPKFGDILRSLRQPRVLLMLLLGFSSGLPFMLTGNTLGYWLRDSGSTLAAIGFLSWVGLAYSFKFLWAPIVDRVGVPFLDRLGRRRGWIILCQIVLAAGLVAMAMVGPAGGLTLLGAFALVVAFASATQDVAIDALRIESAKDEEENGLFTGAFALGYRIALLIADALILIMAQEAGWPLSYVVMAALIGVGFIATLIIKEKPKALELAAKARPLWTPRGLFDGVVGPFTVFFRTFGAPALLILLMIALYRLPDFMMGPMASPFYHDLGFSKAFVGGVRATSGLAGTLVGISIGGLAAATLSRAWGLIVGGVLQGLAIASFSLLAFFGPSHELFAGVMFADNVGIGAAGVILVAYMSSLVSLGYAATQYALLSSSYTWVGKFLKGFSGQIVESIQHSGYTLMQSYGIYFIACGLIGVPALLLVLFVANIRPRADAPNTLAVGSAA